MKASRLVFYTLMLLCHASALNFNTTTKPEVTTSMNITTKLPIRRSSGNSLPPEIRYLFAGIYAVVFMIGVTGNVLVLQTVASKQMRTVKNVLIGNLAVADLLTCLICLPLTVTKLFIPWPFGEFICKFIFPNTDVFVSVSILTLCTITLDRFRAIVHPFTRKMSIPMTAWVTISIWVGSFLVVGVPIMQLMKLKKGTSGLVVCAPTWPSRMFEETYRLVILILLYIMPVCLIFFCFVCIGRKIKQNMRFMRESVRDTRSLARLQRRSRVVKLMFVIFITFTICLLPIHMLLTLLVFYKPIYKWPGVNNTYHSCILILLANSCMNPMILCYMSSEFKRGFISNCLCFAMMRKIKRNTGASHSVFNDENHTTPCLSTALHHFQDSINKKNIDSNKNGGADIPMVKYPNKENTD